MRKRKEQVRHTRKLKYGAGILALSGLIIAALWLPQAFFEVQDNFRYGDVSLMRQEQMDILTLGTGYELSLYRRMANYAEGLAEGRRYYVDEQNKEVTEEMLAFLQSGDVLYRDTVAEIFGSLLLPPAYLKASSLNRWKQYLIYSDDYAQGVNFILWLFELTTPEGYQAVILMDAQDYKVYAMKAAEIERAKTMQKLAENVFYYASENAALWVALNICYNVFDQDNAEGIVFDLVDRRMDNISQSISPVQRTVTDNAGYDVILMIPRTGAGELSMQDGTPWYGRTEDYALYYLLPFRGNLLTFTMDSRPDAIVGIREIYELIPEFQK